MKPAFAVTLKITGLPSLSIVEDEVRGVDVIKPIDEPAVGFSRHRHSRPVGGVTARVGIPVVEVNAVGPVGGLLEMHNQVDHGRCSNKTK